MVSFRDVIRAALRERRLSARALALMVDISQQYASQIMRGEKIPSDEVVLRIADVLGLDRRELLMLAHREKAPPEAKPFFDPSPRVELAARRLRIPVISYVSAGVPFQWTDQGFPPGAGMDYIVMDRTLLPGVHPDEAESCYAVKVRGDSMSPFLARRQARELGSGQELGSGHLQGHRLQCLGEAGGISGGRSDPAQHESHVSAHEAS